MAIHNTHHSHRTAAGFTLIEVLIALAVLAIAMIAIFQAVQMSVMAATRVKQKIIAHTVVMSVMSNLQSGVLNLSNDTTSGTDTSLNQSWTWQVQLLQDGERFARVSVSAMPTGSQTPTDTVEGFVWKREVEKNHVL